VNWVKISTFAIKYWRELLVIVSLSLVALKTQMDYRALNKAYETSREEMELQISSLRDIHAEELRQREEALQSYRDTLERIQQSYLESQVELEQSREERTTEYIRRFSQDKESLSNEIIDAYGFQFVE
jgi:response regulator RpfG family c-di-GMP phosphodiesterase